MNALPNLPTLKDEIDRKAFETIDWLATSFDKGKLNDQQYAAGLEVLFMAVSGLCDNDIVDLISTASGIVGVPVAATKRHFVKGGMVVTLTWVADEEQFHLAVRENGVEKVSQHKSFGSAKEARDGFGKHAARLLDMGYVEL